MSFDALAWAAKQQTGSSGTKLVLMGLAECASRKEAHAFPSIAELIEFSALNRKSVIANLDKLEALGFIADTGDRVGRTKQVKVYRICLERVPQMELFQKRNRSVSSAKSPKNGTRNKSEPVGLEANAPKPRRTKFAAPDKVSDEQWAAFQGQRRKPLNERAYVLLCNKLQTLSDAGWPPGDMIDRAIERGWETVFAPRNQTNGTQHQPSLRGTRPDPALDLLRAARAAEAAERPDGQDHWRTRPPLQAIGRS